MRPKLAWFGGVAAFAALLLSAAYFVLLARLESTLASALGHALLLAIYALTLVVLWATKALFNAAQFRAADVLILLIMVLPGLATVGVILVDQVGLLGGSVIELSKPTSAGTMHPRFLVLYGFPLLWSALGILFGISALRYAKRSGGIWVAIGIVYIAGWSCLLAGLGVGALALFDESLGLFFFGFWSAFALFWLGGAVVAAGWICHGIGLIIAARQMRQA